MKDGEEEGGENFAGKRKIRGGDKQGLFRGHRRDLSGRSLHCLVD